jgi:NAD(P)H-hydrate epimerase
MKVRPLTRDEVREIDRRAIEEYGVPGIVLMENAGRGAAAWLAELGSDGPIVFCCGKGNNGGDAYVMARHLEVWGFEVRVLLACRPDDISGDARTNLGIIERAGLKISVWSAEQGYGPVRELFAEAAWVVDGLLGTGIQGPVQDPYKSLIDCMNESPGRRFAIDIPSGLDCDTGRPLGAAVVAHYTATFVAPKRGLVQPAAARYVGQLRVFDIGVPRCILAAYAE